MKMEFVKMGINGEAIGYLDRMKPGAAAAYPACTLL